MRIYVVMRCMEYEYTEPVSAHVDKSRADAAAKVFDDDSDKTLYGAVQEVELDLTGLSVSDASDCADAADCDLTI